MRLPWIKTVCAPAHSPLSTLTRVPFYAHKRAWDGPLVTNRVSNTRNDFLGRVKTASMDSKRSLDSHIAQGDRSTAAAASRCVFLHSSITVTKLLYDQIMDRLKSILELKSSVVGESAHEYLKHHFVVQE